MKLASRDDAVRREIAARIAQEEQELNAQNAALDAATARFFAEHPFVYETHEQMLKRLGMR